MVDRQSGTFVSSPATLSCDMEIDTIYMGLLFKEFRLREKSGDNSAVLVGSVVPLSYSDNNYMADSSVRVRLVARRPGESSLYAVRMVHNSMGARKRAIENGGFTKWHLRELARNPFSRHGNRHNIYGTIIQKNSDSEKKAETTGCCRTPPARPFGELSLA